MADNSNLDERVTSLERQVSVVATKVDALSDKIDLVVSELRDFKNEVRADRARQDEDMREIRASIDGMGKHVRNLAITSMAAIGGMAIAVGAMVVAVLMK